MELICRPQAGRGQNSVHTINIDWNHHVFWCKLGIANVYNFTNDCAMAFLTLTNAWLSSTNTIGWLGNHRSIISFQPRCFRQAEHRASQLAPVHNYAPSLLNKVRKYSKIRTAFGLWTVSEIKNQFLQTRNVPLWS